MYFAVFSQPAAPFSSVDVTCYFTDSDPSLGWSRKNFLLFVQLPYFRVHIQMYCLYPCVGKIKAELKAHKKSKKLVRLWSHGQQCSWRWWKTWVWPFTCCRVFPSTWLTDGLRCMSPNINKDIIYYKFILLCRACKMICLIFLSDILGWIIIFHTKFLVWRNKYSRRQNFLPRHAQLWPPVWLDKEDKHLIQTRRHSSIFTGSLQSNEGVINLQIFAAHCFSARHFLI